MTLDIVRRQLPPLSIISAFLLLVFSGFSPVSQAAAANTCATPIDTQATYAGAQVNGRAHQVEVDGHPIAVWSKSPRNPKATVLLVHGRTWSGRPDFDLATGCEDLSLMNGLVEKGIAAFAVDMRGYGQTPRDKSGWLTPDRAAADIAGVLRWLNANVQATANNSGMTSKAHLFGWSYGATMAQLSVQKNPELARSLSLFGYAVRRGYAKTPKTLPATPSGAANTHTNAISDFIVPNSISPEAIEAFATAALRADPVRADWNQLEQWRALDGRRVPIPTLLLQGEFDPLTRPRVHKRLFRRLPNKNKEWVVFKNGDHAAFMEAPRQKFINTLSRFILALESEQTDSNPKDTK